MANNANSKLRSSRRMATRLVSSPSPLVAFSFVAWMIVWWLQCLVVSSHVFFTFCKAKKLLEVTDMCVCVCVNLRLQWFREYSVEHPPAQRYSRRRLAARDARKTRRIVLVTDVVQDKLLLLVQSR